MQTRVCLILISWITATGLLTGCEEKIDVDIEQEKKQLVVEGHIEANQPPVVFLTKSVPYFASFNIHKTDSFFIHGATITVSNGSKTVTLQEQKISSDTNELFLYTTTSLLGEYGERYDLTVQVNGKTLTSSTRIPQPLPLDSVWSTPRNDSLAVLRAHFTDPDTLGNFIRYFTLRNPRNPNFQNQQCLPYAVEEFAPAYIFDDQYYNGNSFDLPLDRGQQIDEPVNPQTYGYFWKGDTVIVKWCTIDKAHYDFWETWEYTIVSFDNPFASPTRIDSNIEGGLGIWGGYGCTCHITTIPEK